MPISPCMVPKNNNVTLSILILLMGIVSFYLLSKGPKATKPLPKAGQIENSSFKEDKADRYYRSLYLKKMHEEMQVDNEKNRREARRGLNHPNIKNESQWPGLDAQQEQAWRFEEEKRVRDFDVYTPEDHVQAEIRRRQEEQFENERLQREFIRQLQENARRDGIEIRIDKNLRAYPVGPSPQ